MKKIIWSLLIAGSVSSCAFHSGNISSGPLIDCPMKSIVTGQARTVRILGMGGLDKNALILEAKQNLYNKYQTSRNIKLTNFSVDFKTTFILFYSSTLATVSAELYDCGSSISETNNSDLTPMIEGLRTGDSIIYENEGLRKGKFKSHTDKDKCLITIETVNGSSKDRKVNSAFIYKTSPHPENISYYGYDVGEKASVEVFVLISKTKVIKPCTIIGLNQQRLLISYLKDDGTERILSVDRSLVKK